VQDRPTALELLAAVREFLEAAVVPALGGVERFHARVAANVLAIVEREIAVEEQTLLAEWERLARLLGHAGAAPARLEPLRGAVRGLTETLSARIREGEADRGPFGRAVRDHLRETVREKLRVANPRYLGG
jgi:uncharacterized protein DUF6285